MIARNRLHPEGPEVSDLVWGLWRVQKGEATSTPEGLAGMIAACLELGITTFDLADIYGDYQAETVFGRGLRAWGGDRAQIQLISKCGIKLVHPARPGHRIKHYDSSAEHIRGSVDASLAALGTDHLDLLLLHRPDPLMDADATASALEALIRDGRVRHVGVSNHLPGQVDLLQSRLSVPLVTNQIEFSATHLDPLDDGTLDQAQRLRFRPMIWSPLGGGTLFRDHSPRGERVRGALQMAAETLGSDDPGAVALAWLLCHPSRPVPVLGSGRIDRLRSLARAVDLTLDRQAWFQILEASRGHPVA